MLFISPRTSLFSRYGSWPQFLHLAPKWVVLIVFEVRFKNQSSHLDSYQRKVISSDVAVTEQTPNQNHHSCSNCGQTQSSLKQTQKERMTNLSALKYETSLFKNQSGFKTPRTGIKYSHPPLRAGLWFQDTHTHSHTHECSNPLQEMA